MSNRQGVWSLAAQYQAIADQDWTMAPGAPTGVSATAGSQQATVTFTAPTFAGIPGTITGFKVTSSEGETATGSASPITVSSLTNGTAYTFTVQAQNAIGLGKASDASSSVTPRSTRGVFAGGGFNTMNTIVYFQINSGGENASDFGDLNSSDVFYCMGLSSSTRAIFGGGNNGGNTFNDKIDYITIASTGNATDFGDFRSVSTNVGAGTSSYQGAACSNSTRGVIARGAVRSSREVVDIDYLTIASTGDTQDFGDLSGVAQYAGALASTTRGIIFPNTGFDTAEYVTIASTGNATDFGAYNTAAGGGASGASSNTRGLFIPGGKVDIRYATIASTGGFVDFGDLTTQTQASGFTSDNITAVRVGGYNGSAVINVMDQVTIASTGNATDFGDLTQTTYGGVACSDSHGGL